MNAGNEIAKLLAACCWLSAASALGEALVARTAMEPRDFFHATYRLMDRNYWTIAISDTPLFPDCGVCCRAYRLPPGLSTGTSPVTWRTVRENYTDKATLPDGRPWNLTARFPGVPILALCNAKRGVKAMSGAIDLDYDDYAKFKAENPSVFAFCSFAEMDNDSRGHYGAIQSLPDADPRKAELTRDWGTRLATDRYKRLAQVRQYFDRKAALYYGDLAHGMSECSLFSIEHITAAWGAGVVSVETTGTTETSDYRWDVMGMFARGAARQFARPWLWFTAIHSCGYPQDLSRWSISGATYRGRNDKFYSPNGGLSRSLLNRLYYYAYVNGANFIQNEGIASVTDPKGAMTAHGRDYARFHAFARENPGRGSTFAHCAILTPFAQMYPGFGGAPGVNGDYAKEDAMVDGAFFTVVPPPTLTHKELARIGVESNNLHNTSFAMSYDVLVPDSPQKPADFQKILGKYPVAYLAGKYRAEDDITTPLVKYVSEGGTLVLNAIYLDRFPKDFAGVAWNCQTTFAEQGVATDERGATVKAGSVYDVAELKLAGAAAFLTNATGRALMTTFAYGKGRVLVTAPLYMAPRGCSFDGIEFGRVRFPFVRYLLARLQDEAFPVRVTGDCQYGINRTETGWWLWMLNNRGVRKFTDTAETVDEACASKVEVDFRDLGITQVRELVGGTRPQLGANGFTAVVPAGGVKIYELK